MVPDPPLVQRAARKDVRLRWIGRYVRFSRKLLIAPSPEDPNIHELQLRQQGYNSLGYGRILDVGKSGRFLIRWENGSESQECKRALDFYKDEATAATYGPRLLPLEYGGGDLRG